MSYGINKEEDEVRFTPVSLELGSETFDHGFIDVFTTSPRNPFFARVHFENGRISTATIDVPSHSTYECLCLSAYVYYKSSMERSVPNHCGYAYVTKGMREAVFQHRHDADPSLPPALGRLTFKLRGAPRLATAYPATPASRRLAAELGKRASVWYETQLKPMDAVLKAVHIPNLPCPFPWLPGFAFAAQRPAGPENELLFERALKSAATRRRLSLKSSLTDETFSTLMVEALACIPNCNVYNEDCLVSPGRAPSADEAFYADPRTIGNGDCEDEAHEVCNLACSLRTGAWSSPLVRRAQKLLRRYVVTEMFAGVKTSGGADVSRYEIPVAGRRRSSLYAHAYVMFLPARWVADALQRGGGEARLSPALVDVDGSEETLVADGVSLFAAQPLKPFVACCSALGSLKVARVQTMQRIGDDYYKLLSSCMIVDGSVVSSREQTPVYELGFSTADGVSSEKYGAKFTDAVALSDTIALRPSCLLTAKENDFVLRCVRYLHPIAPYKTDAAEPDLTLLEKILQAKRIRSPPSWNAAEFFIQSSDTQDEAILRDIKSAVLGEPVQTCYRLDFFADGVYSVHVYIQR